MIYFQLAGLLFMFAAGWGCEAYRWHAADLAREVAGLNSAVSTDAANQQKEVKYVDRIVEIQAAPRVVVKRELVNRVCPASSPGVPGQPSADEARAEAAADALAAEIKECLAAVEQLSTIQDQVEPQLPKGRTRD